MKSGEETTNLYKVLFLQRTSFDPTIVVDGGPWYPWPLGGMGIDHHHGTFGNRSRVERWFRHLKERTRRFYNNVNSGSVDSIEEVVSAIAYLHNLKLNLTRGDVALPS